MILADTNVIIDFWKSPTERMRNIFIEEDVAVTVPFQDAVLAYLSIKNKALFGLWINILERFQKLCLS